MDDGQGGDFTVISSANSLLREYTITSTISKGYVYRFRYRVRNSIGFSAYSSIGYI